MGRKFWAGGKNEISPIAISHGPKSNASAHAERGWINMHTYNFFQWTKVHQFFWFNCLSISLSVSEIFALKLESCPKSHQILDVFALPNLKEVVPPKSCTHFITRT